MLGKLPVPGRPTNLDYNGQGPTMLTAGAGGGGLDFFFFRLSFQFFLPLSGRRSDID